MRRICYTTGTIKPAIHNTTDLFWCSIIISDAFKLRSVQMDGLLIPERACPSAVMTY